MPKKRHFFVKRQRISLLELLERKRKGIEDEEKHSKSIERIIQNPSSIGLNNIISAYKETCWYPRYPGGTPDIIMNDGKLLYLIEYKNNHSSYSEKRGLKQLRIIGEWFNSRG